MFKNEAHIQDISNRIMWVCVRYNVKAADLARILCIGGSTVGRVLTGQQYPSAIFLSRMAAIFGVSIDWLLGTAGRYAAWFSGREPITMDEFIARCESAQAINEKYC